MVDFFDIAQQTNHSVNSDITVLIKSNHIQSPNVQNLFCQIKFCLSAPDQDWKDDFLIKYFHFIKFLLIFEGSGKARKQDESVFLKRGFKELRKDADQLIFSEQQNILGVRVNKRLDMFFKKNGLKEEP